MNKRGNFITKLLKMKRRELTKGSTFLETESKNVIGRKKRRQSVL